MDITIKDVAKFAGVGVATVSRVINQSGYVGVETRERVLRAMRELSFNPSSIARGLVSGKTATIGLLIPDVANPFFSDIARGTEDAAIAEGYSVLLCNSDWQPEREKMYLNLLRGKWVDGVIIVGSRSTEDVLDKALDRLPFALVDRKRSGTSGISVWVDNEKGAEMATRHLIEMGCRSLAHISGPSKSPSAIARLKGFQTAVRIAGLKNTSVIRGDFRHQGGYNAALSLLKSSRRPDGIFSANDLMAVGVVQAAAHMGIRVPDDLKVVGYDNIPLAEYVSPSITTIEQPAYEMGRVAFQMLHPQLTNGVQPQSSTDREFEPRLIRRRSTDSFSS